MDIVKKGKYIFPVIETIEKERLEVLIDAVNVIIGRQKVKYFVQRVIEITIDTEAKTTKIKYIGVDESGDERVLFITIDNETLKKEVKEAERFYKLGGINYVHPRECYDLYVVNPVKNTRNKVERIKKELKPQSGLVHRLRRNFVRPALTCMGQSLYV